MGRKKAVDTAKPVRKMRPALTPEARDKQCISLAYDLVMERLMDGTATSQETTYFLKLGSAKEQRELERLEQENKLLKAKAEAYELAKQESVDRAEVIKALKSYRGFDSSEEEDEDIY